MQRSGTGVVIGVVTALPMLGGIGCSDRSNSADLPVGRGDIASSGGPISGPNLGALGGPQVVHQYRLGSRVQSSYASTHYAGSIAVPRSVIKKGDAWHIASTPQGLIPSFVKPPQVDLALSHQADGHFVVEHKTASLRIEARLLEARPVSAVVSDGLVTYPQAYLQGGSVIQRATEDGIEDFVELLKPSARAEVGYSFRLLSGVSGLRLVGNTLEFIDGSGAPSLRVAAPYIVTAKGERVAALLDVEGCAVDRDPTPPWGRTPVAPEGEECKLWVRWDDSKVTYPALLDPAWVATSSMSTARSGASAELLANGQVLIAGGVSEDHWSCLDSAEVYNPSTRTFAATSSLAAARCWQASARLASGQVIVTGGVSSQGDPLATTEIYDVANGIWIAGKDMRVARANHRMALLNSGDLLVAGGTTVTAEKRSAKTGAWSSAGTLVEQAVEHTLTLLSDGRALLVGGVRTQVYLPSSNNWYPGTAPLASEHFEHTATRLGNGQVLIVGAQTPTTELFDGTTNSWQHAAAAVVGRAGHTATLLGDGQVLIAGGVDLESPGEISSELYNPKWGTFTPGPALAIARRDHSAVLLPSGRVLALGGIDGSYNTLASAEEFNPTALDTVTTEYKLPAKVDTQVLADRMTELWASVTRPVALSGGKRYPILLFLHGNHGTCGVGTNPRHDYGCEYTDSGSCPAGATVTPNHRGYDYITSALAAKGYVVVSINANRGINCGWGTSDDSGLNLARGRLILRHLAQLSEWNRGVSNTPASLGFSLLNRLDLSQVGLLGHSRGGEGVRAAYQQYLDPNSPWPARIADPLTIRGIFEIGPVDGQTSRTLNAEGTRWNVLLPMCDGDVSDLEGVRPFDRMMGTFTERNSAAASTYTVWGANHNFFNTEWQDTDSGGCTDHRALFNVGASGSAEQRQTGLTAVTEFFLANVGTAPLPALDELFNPEKRLSFDSRIERGFSPGQSSGISLRLEDFMQPAGTSTFKVPNTHSSITVSHGNVDEHDPALRAALIRWTAGGTNTYFQTNFAAMGSGVDLSRYQTLDFRVGRAKDPLNVLGFTNITVQLVGATGALSSGISAADFVGGIIGPVGGPGNYHQMLSTARIPLGSFGWTNLATIRGVRFTFSETPTGAIYLANVRASRSTLYGGNGIATAPAVRSASAMPESTSVVTVGSRAVGLSRQLTSGNAVSAIRSTSDQGDVEITLTTDTAFAPRADLLVLDIGTQQAQQSRHPLGNTKQVIFTLPRAAFDAAHNGDLLVVHYQRGSGDRWLFGRLDKSALSR